MVKEKGSKEQAPATNPNGSVYTQQAPCTVKDCTNTITQVVDTFKVPTQVSGERFCKAHRGLLGTDATDPKSTVEYKWDGKRF